MFAILPRLMYSPVACYQNICIIHKKILFIHFIQWSFIIIFFLLCSVCLSKDRSRWSWWSSNLIFDSVVAWVWLEVREEWILNALWIIIIPMNIEYRESRWIRLIISRSDNWNSSRSCRRLIIRRDVAVRNEERKSKSLEGEIKEADH